MKESVIEYDERGNIAHYNNFLGTEYWYKYDKNNNLVSYKNLDGYESWREYDENNVCIHYKNTDGEEEWFKYGKNKYGRMEITQHEFKQIERAKLYLNNKRINRFEIMDI